MFAGSTGGWAPRFVHPGAWWLWACCLGAAATQTTNPMLLLLALGAVVFVVVNRRPDAPWARSFRMYLYLGVFVVVSRVLLFVLVGAKTGPTVLVRLPAVDLPSWAAGIQLLGPIAVEDLAAAASEGLRLATMITCFGAANVLANPRRLLRSLPAAVRDVGTAVVIALTVVPQLAESAVRVRRARQLRGSTASGLRGVPQIALPVLQDTLDRSLLLAASMDARGFGNRAETTRRDSILMGALSLGGLMALCVGLYGLLGESTSADGEQTGTPLWIGRGFVALGLLLGALGLWWGGRKVPYSVYRPDPWRTAETLVALCGVAAFALVLEALRDDPIAASLVVDPTVQVPHVPLLAVVALLVAALPGLITPALPATPKRAARARAFEESAG